MMEFNQLMELHGITATDVAVMLHTPAKKQDKYALLALVEDARDLFEAYQDNHPANAESTLKKRKYAASFVVGDDSESLFVGLYEVKSFQHVSAAPLDADEKRVAVQKRFRASTFTEELNKTGKDGRAVFELVPLPALADLEARLVVKRLPGRAYMRKAENTKLEVVEIKRDRSFVPPPPAWTDFIITAAQLRTLPKAWAARLQDWRGIYLIVDQKDGMRYVGSACGAENLWGRWTAHVAGDLGATAELGQRPTENFRFSILELLAPTAVKDAVVAAEGSWKRRLDTLKWGLNKN